MPIDNPAVIQSYPYKSSMTGRSHIHGCSKVVMINSRSLVYTSPPTTPSDQYRITTGTYMYNKQNPMSTIGSCMHPQPKNINHQEDIKILRNNLVNYEYYFRIGIYIALSHWYRSKK